MQIILTNKNIAKNFRVFGIDFHKKKLHPWILTLTSVKLKSKECEQFRSLVTHHPIIIIIIIIIIVNK